MKKDKILTFFDILSSTYEKELPLQSIFLNMILINFILIKIYILEKLCFFIFELFTIIEQRIIIGAIGD